MELVAPGSSGGGGGQTLHIEIPVGTVDDYNTIFTVAHEPLYIDVNGASYIEGTGTYLSYSVGVITLSSGVGETGFIRSFYNA